MGESNKEDTKSSSKLNLRHIKFSFSLTDNNSNSPQEYETAPHLLIQAFWVEQLGKETLKEVPSTEQGTVKLENINTSNILCYCTYIVLFN